MEKNEIIQNIKAENPSLKIGDDEQGYRELSVKEYEEIVNSWADARIVRAAKKAEAEAIATSKLDAIEKLTALGIDPKALGL